MKVALINPLVDGVKADTVVYGDNESALGIGYIASFLEKNGQKCDIFDCTHSALSCKEVIDLILNKYDIVGVSCFSYNYKNTVYIVNRIKHCSPKTFVFLGGYVPTIGDNNIMRTMHKADCFIIGEGEQTVLDIVISKSKNTDWRLVSGIMYFDDGILKTTNVRKYIDDLDKLPFPKRLPLVKKSASIITSRGCYGQCSFCCAPAFYKKCAGKILRHRSPQNVVDEIEFLNRSFGVEFFKINDDNFMINQKYNKEWVKTFCDEIIKRNLKIQFRIMLRANEVVLNNDLLLRLKKTGLQYVFVGIESFVQRQLNYYNKKISVETNIAAINCLKNLNLKIRLGFILLDPYVSLDEIKENISYLIKTEINENLIEEQELISCMSPLIPLSGSEFYNDIKQKVNLKNNIAPLFYSFNEPIVNIFYYYLNIWKRKISELNLDISKSFSAYGYKNKYEAKKVLFLKDLYFIDKLVDLIEYGQLDVENVIQEEFRRVEGCLKKQHVKE